MSAVAVCPLQSSMPQCPLAQPDDSSHHELLIFSASSGQQLQCQWCCDPWCCWCTWRYFRLYSDKMWVPVTCDSSPCFRLQTDTECSHRKVQVTSTSTPPFTTSTINHGLLRYCEGRLSELCDRNVASCEVGRHQDTKQFIGSLNKCLVSTTRAKSIFMWILILNSANLQSF